MNTTNNKTALLVIDVQNDYWVPPRRPRDKFLNALRELIDYAHDKGILVIYIKHASLKKGKGRFQEGTPGFAIHSSVRPAEDDIIIVKHTPGAFYETNLGEILQLNNIENLIISGMQTQKCCDTTTREASARKYNCYFVTDAVETFNLFDHNGDIIGRDEIARATFATLKNGFANVVSFEELKGIL